MKKLMIFILAGAGLSAADAAEPAFIRADTDQDGKISKAEYTEVLKQRFEEQGKEGHEKAAEVQFKRKDKNNATGKK